MRVRVNSNWHLYGHTSLNVDDTVEVIDDNGDEVDILFEDCSFWTVPSIVLDMQEYRMTVSGVEG
ncbi:hypothetical protein PP939_gp252 [Rhizobium phage RL38J1]|uniref:Uncharacterized protein n=1 Tax=Rhizobium phage RL38J1 TaxID=2663232 RepID=A0A6B9JD19_9CAUD|nr:hypothetical protein PP939_gp252 [Rhizobium phage RL38J1]QGZ14076.1 hypothetical protein RL38J1_252 [Rhizobium phage RL38J1]